jgi:hypothetical protein
MKAACFYKKVWMDKCSCHDWRLNLSMRNLKNEQKLVFAAKFPRKEKVEKKTIGNFGYIKSFHSFAS